MTKKGEFEKTNELLQELAYIMKYLLAIELKEGGVPQVEIGKRLKIATKKVNQMLRGIKNLKD